MIKQEALTLGVRSRTSATIPIWLVGVSFVLFQFFLQLSSGIVIGAIMQEKHLSALAAGLLSSAFYYVYTTMQIPVGLLFDHYNTRKLLAYNAAICALGCLIFSATDNLVSLYIGRLLIGAGASFAFVGLAQLVRQHFPLKHYVFVIGLSETLSFTLTVLAMIGLGTLIHYWGWRSFITVAGLLGVIIALFCWQIIPDNVPHKTSKSHQPFLQMLKSPLAWINGWFICLEFSVITVFGALWSVPFLQVKLGCSLSLANALTSMILLGAGISCPLFGHLAIHFRRKPLIHFSCWSTAFLILIVLFCSIQNILLMGLLLFSIGLCCGAYVLAFSIASDLAPADCQSASAGFTNTLAMLSAPLLQPLVGFFLDRMAEQPGVYLIIDYQYALIILPVVLMVASFLSHFLPESGCKT